MGKFFAFLRFLNLLEPGSRVLSISKFMMWAATFGVVVAFFRGEGFAEVVTAAGVQIVAVGNYVHRRQINVTRRNEYIAEESGN